MLRTRRKMNCQLAGKKTEEVVRTGRQFAVELRFPQTTAAQDSRALCLHL